MTDITCPYCGTDDIGTIRETDRDDGHIIDVECESGHVGTLAMPKRINEDDQ